MTTTDVVPSRFAVVVLSFIVVLYVAPGGRVSAGGGMKFEPDEDAEVYDSGFASSGKMSFSTPDLDDEDQYSLHMPDQLLCDACRILSHVYEEKFDKVHSKRPSLKNLPESAVLDAVESLCKDDFNSVGIKEIKGIKRLSGPGLDTRDVPGIMQGGGKWPIRMQQLCNQYAGELEEENIYDAYKEKNLKQFLCEDQGRHCAKVAKKTAAKKTVKKPVKNTKTKKDKEEL